MENLSIPLLVLMVGLTSLAAFLVGTRRLGLTAGRLRRAGARTLDCVGLGLVFLLANLLIGAAAILGLRALTGAFVSLYFLNDATLAVLSGLQALVFQWWRAGRA